MSRDRFCSLVREASLFFCRADRLDDRWEGAFPIKVIEKFDLAAQSLPSDDGHTYTGVQWHVQKEARSHLVNCWHVNDVESFAMWKIYGGGSTSVAIQSTIGRLKRSLDANKERIWIGDVEYIDFREWEAPNRSFNVGSPNTLKAFFCKWHYFRFENEIRAVINKAYSVHGAATGIPVPVNLTDLIDRIYISPVGSDEDEEEIRAMLETAGCAASTYRSDLGLKLYM